MITNGIYVGGKHSYRDFDLYIAARHNDIPEKDSIKERVPYSNKTYDFSRIGGGDTYGDRVLSYTFDIVGETVEEMERNKTAVINWLSAVFDEDIYDDDVTGYHFHGSYSGKSWSEDGAQGQLTVTFACYPFQIANTPTETAFFTANDTKVINNAGQPVKPTINAPSGATVTINGVMQSVSGKRELITDFATGENTVKVAINDALPKTFVTSSGTVYGITFTFDEEKRTITANGTAERSAWFYFATSTSGYLPPVGNYHAYGCAAGGTANTYYVNWVINTPDGNKSARDYGNGAMFTVGEDAQYVSAGIGINANVTVENLVFTPRLFADTSITFNVEVL